MNRRGSSRRRASTAAWGRMKSIDGLLSTLSKFTQNTGSRQDPAAKGLAGRTSTEPKTQPNAPSAPLSLSGLGLQVVGPTGEVIEPANEPDAAVEERRVAPALRIRRLAIVTAGTQDVDCEGEILAAGVYQPELRDARCGIEPGKTLEILTL